MSLRRAFKSAALRILAATVFVLTAGGAHADKTIADGSGRQVAVSDTSRILAIGGDVTEILYALGAGDKIIAIDSTSQYPAEALKAKANVGYLRSLSAEGVLSTNPTVIIAGKDAGPPPVVAVLKSSSIPYVQVPDDKTPEGVVAKIRFVASVIGAETAGDKLAKEVAADFAKLAEERSKITAPKRALFVLSVQNGRAVVAGSGTSADAMFKLAGVVNAGSATQGYEPLADEAGVELAPDAVVMMQPGRSGPPSDPVASVKALASSPALKQNNVVQMDSLYLLGFGPRCARAAHDLMAQLYPELAMKRASTDK